MLKPKPPTYFIVLLAAQGIYYFITGLWPLLHIESFMQVSGWKVDQWLVKMVGALILPVAFIVLRAALLKVVTWETLIIATGSAFAFLAIDVYYAGIGRISQVYLLDAVVQVVIIMWWIVAWAKTQSKQRQ